MTKKTALILIILLWGATRQATAQSTCDAQTFKDICIKKIPEYFVFSKSYALEKQVTEHENILTKLKAYIIIADSYRTRIEIYKDEGRGIKTMVRTGEGYVSYVAPSTGKYFIKFTFDESDENNQFCGAAVLAFLR
ncbi:MAG: hypothetical protein MUE85_13825 [Microscillaceae bacterium]|jgi:hypothetical protein|nr:hypothetical protein [Microscillaceae bacterium]